MKYINLVLFFLSLSGECAPVRSFCKRQNINTVGVWGKGRGKGKEGEKHFGKKSKEVKEGGRREDPRARELKALKQEVCSGDTLRTQENKRHFY